MESRDSNSSNDNTKSNEAIKQMSELLSTSIKIQNRLYSTVLDTRDLLIDFQTRQLQNSHPNPLNKFGQKCFSQTDEDGITLEILRRLELKTGNYIEFGVGNGLENNTLILAALGWKGVWIGGEDLAFECRPSARFSYLKTWVTTENIVQLALSGMKSIQADHVDVISLDLDGNDIYFVSELLKQKIRPKLFVVEYNAQFMPPVKFQIPYNPGHRWNGDNYYGAALSNFDELFHGYNYKLVCCNSHTGANAFFIDRAFEDLFLDVPDDIGKIYCPPRYHLYSRYGHRQSPRTIELLMSNSFSEIP